MPFSWRGEISRRDAHAAVSRLAALTAAGIPTGDAIASSAQGKNRLLLQLHTSVRRGVSLSAAMGAAGMPFSEAEVAVIRAGERGGSTPKALALLAERMESETAGRRRIASALAYPCILLVGAITALCFLSIVVLPSFTTLYESGQYESGQSESGQSESGRVELPAITRVLLGFGLWVKAWGGVFLLATMTAVAAVTFARRRSAAFARCWDRLAIDVPPFRALAAPQASQETCSLLALLLGAGCEVEEALTLTARAASNRIVRARLTDALRSLRHGVPLSRAWRGAQLDRSGDISALLEIAEATGGYARAFDRVATLEGAAAEHALAQACRLAEPLAVIAMAVAVGGGVLAVYQPMLGSASLLLGGTS